MESYTIAFCKYASKKFRTYGTDILNMFADICDKVLNNDKEAFNVVSKFVQYNLIYIYRMKMNIRISLKDKNKEFEKTIKPFNHYMCEKHEEFYIINGYGLSNKFNDEVYQYLFYEEEGHEYPGKYYPELSEEEEEEYEDE
ncbi:hypothetical protein M9Y10_017256 [Tritrichomonas musculus]|uniref:Uncharacterized protein n=1 Tax=Tritrichomonas musculus TaxID=1915356 RepID=A0ABR2HVT7_9EUKA